MMLLFLGQISYHLYEKGKRRETVVGGGLDLAIRIHSNVKFGKISSGGKK